MKKILLFLLATIVIFSIVGCGATPVEDENTAETTVGTELNESDAKKEFSFETAESFSIRFDDKPLVLPIDYNDFVEQYDFKVNSVGARGIDSAFLLTGTVKDKYNIWVFLRPSDGFVPPSIEQTEIDFAHTYVSGILINPDEGVDIDFEYSANDTEETIYSKFGEPNRKTAIPFGVLQYEVVNLRVKEKPFNVEFCFDNDTKKLKHILCGDFSSFIMV